MSTTIIIMMLFAAFLHAAWNVIVKASTDKLIGLASINVTSGVIGAVLIVFVDVPDVDVILILLLSVLIHVFYKFGLAEIYKRGELIQLFPIARGVAPLMAVLFAAVLLDEGIPAINFAGILLISLGLTSLMFERDFFLQGRKKQYYWQ